MIKPKPHPLPRPKPERLPERKRVTLIAAFRCTDGMIVCADSQETVGSRRAQCEKIEPFEFGDFDLAISGSGNNGELIDAFVQQVRDAAETATGIHEMKELKQRLHEELFAFMKNEAVLYPKAERAMKYIISASAKDRPDFEVWHTSSSRLTRVVKYKLVGWDEELYRYSVDRLFRESIPISKAIPLAMYLFSIAENTSNFVGGRTAVLIITDSTRMFMESDSVIQEFEAMTEVYSAALDRMLLACTDTALSSADFAKRFSEFSETILRFRGEHFQIAAKRRTLRLFTGEMAGLAYRSVPRGTGVTLMRDGTLEAREDPARGERIKKMASQILEVVQDAGLDEPKPSTSEKSEREP